jgi:hypothetical protein
MTGLRALAFGDLESGSWGAAWMPGSVSSGALAVGVGTAATVIEIALDGGDLAAHWKLEGVGSELVLAPIAAPVESAVLGDGIDGFDQLCTVSGHFTLGGDQLPVDCLGWRSSRDGRIDLDRLESFRQVAAWFEPGDGLAVLALRPRKARGQESDVVAAAVLETEHPGPVSEPRLSTTYTATGLPLRAGLELWIDGGSDASSETEREADRERVGEEGESDGMQPTAHEYPRRASGEALGAYADWKVAEFELHAELFRWHNRGRDGAGVYLLGQHQ